MAFFQKSNKNLFSPIIYHCTGFIGSPCLVLNLILSLITDLKNPAKSIKKPLRKGGVAKKEKKE